MDTSGTITYSLAVAKTECKKNVACVGVYDNSATCTGFTVHLCNGWQYTASTAKCAYFKGIIRVNTSSYTRVTHKISNNK